MFGYFTFYVTNPNFFIHLTWDTYIVRGVCISDMIPFYIGKIFRKSGATDDISSKVCSAGYFDLHKFCMHIMLTYLHILLYIYDCFFIYVPRGTVVRDWQRESNGHYTHSKKIWESCWIW